MSRQRTVATIAIRARRTVYYLKFRTIYDEVKWALANTAKHDYAETCYESVIHYL